MPGTIDNYEVVVGLEVHAQLLTKIKLFSSDSTFFGNEPNSQTSVVTLAHPGTLPRLNKKAVEFAVKMGIASNSTIERKNYFARKHYFYPDLPKGYQLSQHTTPICKGGYLTVNSDQGEKKIRLNRIHLEEDAGKSIHDIYPDASCIDLNRAGVPLIEIVSEPDIRSGQEAYNYLTELRKILRYLKVCDGNMEEGSMRCDANISVRKKGVKELGRKVEVKNLNSIRNVKRAIEYEMERMIELLEEGKEVVQQTMSFDAETWKTFPLRVKEEANDYRYFTDPDVPAFTVTDEMLDRIKKEIPLLPAQLIKKYVGDYGLSEYDAALLTEEKELSDYFESVLKHTSNYKAAANWLTGPVKSCMNESGLAIESLGISPLQLAELIQLTDEGKISFSIAASRIFPVLVERQSKTVIQLVKDLNLIQTSDTDDINSWVDEVLKRMPDKVDEYRKGKKGLMGLFVGEVKKASKGKADLKLVSDILIKKLKK